ncbi:MAG: DNA repair protein RecO C-terminal domain-containing protein, partial [Spirochaetes bacterium]|nr:DNA repair protein RecO C-terminal domain-containing protein [Spirochaetota bacterium]
LFTFFSEILLKTYISPDEFKKFYLLLQYSIELLKQKLTVSENTIKIFLFFSFKYMILAGYQYHFAGCKTCSQSVSKPVNHNQKYYFEPNRGGVFCQNHSQLQEYPLNEQLYRLAHFFSISKIDKISELKLPEQDYSKLYHIILDFFNHLFENKIKSIEMLKQIF